MIAARKLKAPQKESLRVQLEGQHYTCGAAIPDFIPPSDEASDGGEQPDVLRLVYVRGNLTCSSTIELPYYSSGIFQAICVHCSMTVGLKLNRDTYPNVRWLLRQKAEGVEEEAIHSGQGWQKEEERCWYSWWC